MNSNAHRAETARYLSYKTSTFATATGLHHLESGICPVEKGTTTPIIFSSESPKSSHSIVSLLLDIQKSQVPQQKFLRFVKNFECLRHKEIALEQPLSGGSFRHGDAIQQISFFRYWIDAFDERDYVALSYTWNPSRYEDKRTQRYQVQTRDRRQFLPSKVRDCIFDRITTYMDHFDLKFLWIDRHCIRQKTCKQDVCSHENCNEKRKAIHAMDLVYKLSNHPIALLGRPIGSRYQLKLLAKILKGTLVEGNPKKRQFRLSGATDRKKAGRALALLHKITRDLWWTRAWTFQENYRAGEKMTLLVHHADALERRKQRYGLFGDVPGELCISSVNFSSESTRLCLAFPRSRTRKESEAIEHILSTAGKYTNLLARSDPMFPTIVSDIKKRGLTDSWDRLAIAANCCQYPIRLDDKELKRKAHSFDLSILAMCLLNGEILHNGTTEGLRPASQVAMPVYLKKHFFNRFYAPEDEHSLTFNKGCRFIDVKLRASGIMTKGHLWRLGRIIRTAEFPRLLPWVKGPRGSLTLRQRRLLTQLADELKSLSHFPLARNIEAYLRLDSRDDGDDQFWNMTFPRRYIRMMAEELATSIDKGKTLRLGSLCGVSKATAPYSAIFIWEDGEPGGGDTWGTECETDFETDEGSPKSASDESERRQRVSPTFAFTASRPKDPGSNGHDANDIDRHVSLEVDYTSFDVCDRVPLLYIKRWLPGLCFFKDHPRVDVLFPWPPSIEAIVP
jgi:Heterokaryon incompatibility protein (HET)